MFYNVKIKLQMNESLILTLEQISDIDTFTLEEKIQQLQQHPHAIFYQQLIAIAKLELQERFKVEEFGRMLINDEIPVFPQIKMKNQSQIEKKPVQSQKKIDLAECLKRSLVPDSQQLFIGKPTLGMYRYVPRQPVSVNREKKSSVRQSKKTQNIFQKRKTEKKTTTLPKIATTHNMKTQKILQQKQQTKPKLVQKQLKYIESHINHQPQHENLQQKRKSENVVKSDIKKAEVKPTIKYIENDVYDGEKLVLDCPQNLAQLQIDTDTSFGEDREEDLSEYKTEQIEITKKQQKEAVTHTIKEQITPINDNKVGLEVCGQDLGYKQDRESYGTLTTSKQLGTKNYQTQNTNQESKADYDVQNYMDLHRSVDVEKMKPSKSENKIKSISHSIQVTKSFQTLGVASKQGEDAELFSFNTLTPHQKQKIENKTIANFTKQKKFSLLQSQKQSIQQEQMQKAMPVYFNYHEIIPTFNKLFPHSNNLINDLRSIEKQLSDHLSKQINQLSLSDQYLRIRQGELLFKVVSESEKAHKYRHMFDINLDSFLSRSEIMVDRIKKTTTNPKQQNMLLYRVVRQKQDVYDIINNAFHRTENWYELPHGMDLKMSWNLLWTWSKPQIDLKELFYFQKVNHFFGNKQIARKDLLKKNIERIKKLGPKAKTTFDIIPQTYFLPGQNMQFVRKFREYSMKTALNYWIMKPVGLSRGRGIELVTKIEQIIFSEPVVIQKYLQNPLLLNGYKFDMRIYVLVTSMNPLQAYVYKEGFARISTQKYSLEDEQVHNKFVHLTNFSVQKQNFEQEQKPKEFLALSGLEKQLGGCKITLKTLKQKLAQQNIAWQSIECQIDSIVLKSLISTMNVIEQNPNCFQLFGYDIIIDENLKCWLIQVNSSPSLEKDFTIDEIIKQQLVDDIVEVVGPLSYDRSRLLQVVTRRRKELEGLKSHINTQNNSTTQLNSDLHYILHGKKLRKYGEPTSNENFRRVAPGPIYQSIIRTVQQYKLSSITKQQAI